MLRELFVCPDVSENKAFQTAYKLQSEFDIQSCNDLCLENIGALLEHATKQYEQKLAGFDILDNKLERILYLTITIMLLLVSQHSSKGVDFELITWLSVIFLAIGIAACLGARSPVLTHGPPSSIKVIKYFLKKNPTENELKMMLTLHLQRSITAIELVSEWKATRLDWCTVFCAIGFLLAIIDVASTLA